MLDNITLCFRKTHKAWMQVASVKHFPYRHACSIPAGFYTF